jgi:hypothetical protein
VACKLDATPAVPALRVSSLAFAVAALVTCEIAFGRLAGSAMDTTVAGLFRTRRRTDDRSRGFEEIPVRSGGVMRQTGGRFARMQLPVAALTVVSVSHDASSAVIRRCFSLGDPALPK